MILSVRQKLTNFCRLLDNQGSELFTPQKKHINCTVNNYHLSQRCLAIFLLWIVISVGIIYSKTAFAVTLSSQAIEWMQTNYGSSAVERLKHWAALINENKTQPEFFKLRLTEDFFGTIPFKSDEEIWNQENYWATPFEFMGKYAGDCEDFAIAKFITLRLMDVPEEKLRLVYVISAQLKQAHMVLAYYETPSSEPLILDNLTDKILYARDRPDLKPIYMFSSKNVWITNAQGSPQQISKYGSQIAAWKDLVLRLKAQGLTEGL